MPSGTSSGLKDALRILKGVEGIKFNTFSEVDVIRHELVKRIIRAYDAYDSKVKSKSHVKGDKVSSR